MAWNIESVTQPAFQQGKRPFVKICCPHWGTITVEWARNMLEPLDMIQQPDFDKQVLFMRGILNLDTERNELVRAALSDPRTTHVLFLDSIPSYTPILVRNPVNKELDVKPISELGVFSSDGLERVNPIQDYEVLDRNHHWTKIKTVIRHPYEGLLKKICCVGGLIDISNNHSIYRNNYRKGTPVDEQNLLVDVQSLVVGDRLQIPDLSGGIHRHYRETDKGMFFEGTKDVAWVHGFFAAEGSASGIVISISNTNEQLLKKSQSVLEQFYNVKSAINISNHRSGNSKTVLKCQIGNKRLTQHFKSLFYTNEFEKRIPKNIFNAPKIIRDSFLDGFIAGDGHVDSRGFQSVITTSQTLAMGIILLLRMSDKTFSVFARKDKPSVIQIAINKKNVKHQEQKYSEAMALRENKHLGYIKIAKRLKLNQYTVSGWLYQGKSPKEHNPSTIKTLWDVEYHGFLYDLSTESERFCGGVAPFLLHNSDNVCEEPTDPNQAIRTLLSLNAPCASGLYRAKQQGGFNYAMWLRNPNGAGYIPIKEWTGNWIPCHVIGFGFVLLKRECFERVPYPWFEWGQPTPCVTPNQNLLSGKKVEDLCNGDALIDGCGDSQTVLNNFKIPYEGEVYEILPSNHRVPITVTPNHRLSSLVGVTHIQLNIRKKSDIEKYKRLGKTCWYDTSKAEERFVQADQLKVNDFIGLTIPRSAKKMLRLENYGFKRKTNNRVYFNFFDGEGLPTSLIQTEDLGELLGYYVAEGSAEPKRGRVRFSFGMHEPEYVNRVIFLLQSVLGISSKSIEGDHALQVWVNNKSLSVLFNQWFGNSAREKTIPLWLTQGSMNLCKGFIRGLWNGDGFKTYTGKKRMCFGLNISSKNVALSTYAILLKFGIRPALQKYVQPKKAFGAGNDIYHIKVAKDLEKLASILKIEPINQQSEFIKSDPFFFNNKLWVKIAQIRKLPYKGYVHDIQVSGSSTYSLEGVCSHNSEDFVFCEKLNKIGIEIRVFTDVKLAHIGVLKLHCNEKITVLDA